MEFKFKEDAEPVTISDELWYALTDGGYIKPEKFLDDEEQLAKLFAAINLVRDFLEQLEDEELVEFV